MKLYLIIGPMFAGKSTFIINQYNLNNNCIAIKPLIDKRYSNNEIVSHDNEHIPCLITTNLMELKEKINFKDLEYLLIDEGQFFNDIEEFVLSLNEYNIKIYIAALNGDFNRNPLGKIYKLYSRADDIIFKQGKCKMCLNKSSFSWKINLSKNQIDIGGEDKYFPVCGDCYQHLSKGSSSHKLSLLY